MYRDASWLDTFGQLIVVFYFLISGIGNFVPQRARSLIARMAELHTPFPAVAYWIGTALQFVGSALLILGWHPEVGVYCLMVFLVVVSTIFHRFWVIPDPVHCEWAKRMLMANIAILGALLFLLANILQN